MPQVPGIIIFQTSDCDYYFDMLLTTSLTVKQFCARSKSRYEIYVGLKMGIHAWQATLNRIIIFNEILQRGHEGWVGYLDADAWINDLDFPIERYLADKKNFGAVLVPSGASDNWWDVNAGVLFLNFGHDAGRNIAIEWHRRLLNVWPSIRDISGWPEGGPDDQSILQSILNDERIPPLIFLESKKTMNSPEASFIRQFLRSQSTDFETRLNYIREEVSNVINKV
jgi:hypothetical protein